MSQILNIISAELYRVGKTSMVKIGLLVTAVFSLFFILAAPKQVDWRANLRQDNIALQENLSKTPAQISSSSSKNLNIVQWKKNQAYLAADKAPEGMGTKIGYISDLLSIRGLGLLLIVFPILFGGGVAREYEQGSLKYALISPIARARLFTGKYLSVLAETLLYLFLALLFNAVLAMAFLRSGSGIAFVYEGGRIVSQSAWIGTASNILLSLPYYLIYATIAFSIGILSRSSTITLSVTIIFALLGTQIVSLMPVSVGVVKWFLPAVLELTHYDNSLSTVESHRYSLVFCLMIIFAYAVVFIVLSRIKFQRADV